MATLPPNGSPGAPMRLHDACMPWGAKALGFLIVGFPFRLSLEGDAANDDLHVGEPPPVRPPPTVRPLDDLSVRRAEREFLRS